MITVNAQHCRGLSEGVELFTGCLGDGEKVHYCFSDFPLSAWWCMFFSLLPSIWVRKLHTSVLMVYMGTCVYNMTFHIFIIWGCVHVCAWARLTRVPRFQHWYAAQFPCRLSESIFMWLMFLFSCFYAREKDGKTDIDVGSQNIQEIDLCVCVAHAYTCTHVYMSSHRLCTKTSVRNLHLSGKITAWKDRWLLSAGSSSGQLVGSDVSQSSPTVLFYIDTDVIQ